VTDPYRVLTFDCYGTLVDWQTGIFEAFRTEAAGDGITLDRAAVLSSYAEVEPAVQAETYRPYREVLRRTAVEVARRVGWTIDIDRARFLPERLPAWPVFPDTNPALRRMREAGRTLGILSNVDDDLIAATCRHLDVEFDFILTAQQLRSYKPQPAHFTAAAARTAGHSWLHVAQSLYHDVVPAHACGIPVLWVDRGGEATADETRPMAVVPDLAAAASWLLD
jgi:2-haloacid dehalogenase/putative hydrolase of the HAD superfamily